MSVVTEIMLFCDGGEACPLDSAINADGQKTDITAAELRSKAVALDGWIKRGHKDFCNACATRLGYKNSN